MGHLKGAFDAYQTARKASGHPDPFTITFEGRVKRLMQAAQPSNTSLGQSHVRGNQSVNVHAVCGNDSEHKDDLEDKEYLKLSNRFLELLVERGS